MESLVSSNASKVAHPKASVATADLIARGLRRSNRTLWLARPALFLTIGLLSALVQGLLLLLGSRAGLPLLATTTGAVLLSALLNFLLNWTITWGDRFATLTSRQRRIWCFPLFGVFVLTSPTIWFKIIGLNVIHDRFGGSLLVTWIVTESLGAVLNFIIADRISFGAMARVAIRVSAPAAATPTTARWRPVLTALRPAQWLKNTFVLAAVPFIITTPHVHDLVDVALLAVAFCLASSSIYLVNDVIDRDRDRLHPRKRFRPIAAGDVSVSFALQLSGGLTLTALAIGDEVGGGALPILMLYLVLSHLYSLRGKHIPYLELALVGVLYGLRVLGSFAAGGLAVSASVPWAVLATLLATALVIGKRETEWLALGQNSASTRPVLACYGAAALPRLYGVMTAGATAVYAVAMWSIAPWAALTTPLIAIAFIRFWKAVEREEHDRNPQDLVLSDRPLCLLILGFALWVTCLSALS